MPVHLDCRSQHSAGFLGDHFGFVFFEFLSTALFLGISRVRFMNGRPLRTRVTEANLKQYSRFSMEERTSVLVLVYCIRSWTSPKL